MRILEHITKDSTQTSQVHSQECFRGKACKERWKSAKLFPWTNESAYTKEQLGLNVSFFTNSTVLLTSFMATHC